EPPEHDEVNPDTVRRRTSSKDLGTRHPPQLRPPSTIARLSRISRSWGGAAAEEVRCQPTDRMCATVAAALWVALRSTRPDHRSFALRTAKRLQGTAAIGNQARRN